MSSAEQVVRQVASQIGMDATSQVLNEVFRRLEQEFVVEDWQLPAGLDSFQWKDDARSEKRRVCFGYLEVRNYPMTVGDHPECSWGAPVTIEWDYESCLQTSVDNWEAARSPWRRTGMGFHLSWKRREMIVRQVNSAPEIRRSMQRSAKLRRQREQTNERVRRAENRKAAAQAIKEKLVRLCKTIVPSNNHNKGKK
jgi:hypothetical protein